jgi:cation-transporting ATPase E
VRERVALGKVNVGTTRASRSLAQILRANLLTRFNAILGALLVVVAVVGPPQDSLFGGVIALNALIGIVQEVRAKRVLDRLAVLTAPVARVVRNGRVTECSTGEVVLDDTLMLVPGDQVVADAEVLSANGLEVDESLLSGESQPVLKASGSELLSGSAILAGSGFARVARVGGDAFAQKLQLEAKRFSSTYSELQAGTNKVLRVISYGIGPVGALLVTSQLVRSHLSVPEALRGAVAGVSAMVPEGLVLLTTLAFALGALRLARRRVLVQALPAIESLARVDVVCVDKTGTLTVPGMTLERVERLGVGPLEEALGAIAAVDVAPNATIRAMAAVFAPPAGWVLVASTPFSSERKWSAAQFEGRGSFVLGGADMVFPQGAGEHLAQLMAKEAGKRVLVLASTDRPLSGSALPARLRLVGAVVLAERLRPDARDTVRYLQDQGVTVKVISGDGPAAVVAIATQAGVSSAETCDARTLPDDPDELAATAEAANIFARVRPGQKRAIVEALRKSGHVVAMTGDGVNDIPALKQADIAIAMGSGSQACRAVGSIVLLDSSFASVPEVLGEGRRVIANIERVANLFITKTAYAALLAIVVGALAWQYPFYPRQLTVVSALTIGVPAFFLALAPGSPMAKAHFLARVLRFSLPAGLGAGAAALGVYGVSRNIVHAPPDQARMATLLALFVVAMFVLGWLSRPLSAWRTLLVVAMCVSGALVVGEPWLRGLLAFAVPSVSSLFTVAAVTTPVLAVLSLLLGRRSGCRSPRENRDLRSWPGIP